MFEIFLIDRIVCGVCGLFQMVVTNDLVVVVGH